MTRRRRGATRAGGFAAARHRQGLRSRRRGIRRPLAALSAPFLAASLLVAALGPAWAQWPAGVAFGALAALWIVARDLPPGHVENGGLGADGERRTAAELAPLEAAGWRVAHDVPARHGNFDHVAVGPTGLFLLETKHPRPGVAEVRDGGAWVRHRHLPELPRRVVAGARVLAAAARLNDELRRRAGCRTWVQAVVVLWCDFPAGVVHDGRCVYVHGTRLRAWLEDQPLRFDPASVAEVAAAVDAVEASAPSDSGRGAALPA